ncbi:hypothetical protein I4F81_009632 [Pyropia yezoensis]|uniref:Uncharacterized protein n=1 Tax=Pyropia yezoensis TaxID=2788 RepID=A0ACC3CBF3_PYRYE|nr:hypothetical protein I4F81_009632 [Neopyropia yezoensis]
MEQRRGKQERRGTRGSGCATAAVAPAAATTTAETLPGWDGAAAPATGPRRGRSLHAHSRDAGHSVRQLAQPHTAHERHRAPMPGSGPLAEQRGGQLRRGRHRREPPALPPSNLSQASSHPQRNHNHQRNSTSPQPQNNNDTCI